MIKILILPIFMVLSFGCADDQEESLLSPSMELEILALVNEHRASLNLTPLQECEICKVEALSHSKRMANGTISFGHDGFDDRFEIIAEATGANSAAENVAEGYSNAKEVVNGWLQSNGHRENIEGDFTHLGTGIAAGSNGNLYFTQIFAKI